MAITVDANVLINAANRQSPRQAASRNFIERAVASDEPLYLVAPVLVAYMRVTTVPGVFRLPLDPSVATNNILAITRMPGVVLASERDGFWERFASVIKEDGVRGRLVHDAHIAVLMYQHEVSTIATYDRDFRLFDGIRVIEP